MVRTPWGNSSELKERKLNPGLGTPREEVAQNQRERLFGAMVASVATKGYKATSVADLLNLSGVSRATFYAHFDGKEACFVATIEAILQASVAIGATTTGSDGPWEERGRRGLQRFIEVIAAQPAAARMCVVESYAAGPAALEPLGKAVDAIVELVSGALEEEPERRGTPAQLTRAVIGGLHWVIYRRLLAGTEAELVERVPEIWEWAMGCRPPPRPLRSRGQRGTARASGTAEAAPFSTRVPGERILRGFASVVAEKGYTDTKIADIAARAQISQATFYAQFDGKEDALLAAIEFSGAQMMAATLPTVRRAKSWPEAVRTALASIFGFLAAEPDFARIQAVEAYVAGPAAIERRERSVAEVVEVTLALALGRQPGPAPIAWEATVGAIGGLLFDHIRSEGPEVLPGYVPLATYVALAPFLGADRACSIARGEGDIRAA